jgi:alginate O-acetyltransferase complex protein AlgI
MSRRTLKPHSWADFASYMALPPIFTAGPIERFDHFLANRASQWSPQLFAEGATRIVHGLVKKFVIAAMLEPSGDSIASQSQLLEMLPDIPTIRVWRYLFRTFLLFYLDFSAYSDVAIGGARLLGVGIQENFDWPILAPNIGAFWKRWHMTLAGWCQSYIYMPLIGKTRNPYVATYLAFLGIGLWHGPTLGWLLWGAWHGTGVAAYVYWTQLKKRRRWVVPANIATRVLSTGLTLAFVSTASVLPAVRNVQDLFGVLRILAKMVFVDV